MSAPPYMKLYWGDYHKKTRHLTRADQHGAYILLIGEAWQQGGSLPDDDSKLAPWAACTADQWAEMKSVIMAFFALRRGRWVHDRVREELAKYESISCKRKTAGKTGGSSSRGKQKGNPQAIATQLPTKPEPESDTISGTSVPSIVSESETRPTKRCPEGFAPDASVYRVAAENGFSDDDMRRELDTMRDYQFRSAHSDWQAVARNWLRKAQPRRHSGQPNLSFRMQDRLLDEVENREVDQEFWRLMEANDAVGHGKGGSDQIGDYGALVALPAPKTHRN